MIDLVSTVEELTASLPVDIRDDVRQEAILLCLEDRIETRAAIALRVKRSAKVYRSKFFVSKFSELSLSSPLKKGEDSGTTFGDQLAERPQIIRRSTGRPATQKCIGCKRPVIKFEVKSKARGRVYFCGRRCKFHQRIYWTELVKKHNRRKDPNIGTRKTGRKCKATRCRCGKWCNSARLAVDHCRLSMLRRAGARRKPTRCRCGFMCHTARAARDHCLQKRRTRPR